jgi:uncharacterized repeat protein (TIGR01451 family)
MTSTLNTRSTIYTMSQAFRPLFALGGLLLAATANAQITFGPEQVINTTPTFGSQTVYAVDIDGDGDQDAVSVELQGGRVLWHENAAGDGSSWIDRVIAAPGSGRAASAGDINGDGNVDVVVAAGDNLLWYQSDGLSPPTWGGRTISGGITSAGGIWVGDIDGDGDLDVASTSNNNNSVYVHINDNGLGTAWTRTTVTSTMLSTQAVVGADVDGDGDTDLVAASDGGSPSGTPDRVSWFENTNGNGTAWTERSISNFLPIGSFNPDPIAVDAADMDGDGDIDVLAAGLSPFNGGRVWLWLNTAPSGDGSSWSLTTLLFAPGDAVYAADLDGDGDNDVVKTSRTSDDVTWFENINGDASSFGLRQISNTNDNGRDVFAADVDGDGDLDILAASSGSVASATGKITWFENSPAAPAGADVALIKSAAPDPVEPSGEVTFSITVTNAGPDAATGVTVSDTLEAGVVFVSASAGCSESGGVVTCSIGDLPASGSSALSIVVTAPSAEGTLSNVATVSANEPDPDPSNNSGSVEIAIESMAPAMYSVAATVSGGNGSVSCTPASVSAGGSSTCTAVPDAGFEVSGWTGDCVSAGDSATCTLTNIQENQSSTVSFAAIPAPIYSVSAATSGGNGSVSCTPTSVVAGGSSTCRAFPDAGFQVSGWSGACAAAGQSRVCSLSNIQSNQASAVSFAPAGPGGAAPIPTLPQWMLGLLAGIMALLAWFTMRRQFHSPA